MGFLLVSSFHLSLDIIGWVPVKKLMEEGKIPVQKPDTRPPDSGTQGRLLRETPGVIVDPYVPVPKELLPKPFTLAGLKARWDAFKRTLRSTLGYVEDSRPWCSG